MSLLGITGFARREGALGAWSWAVEARSVNGRNLEARFRGPPGLEALERVAREGAQARFRRGQIGINVQARRADASAEFRINREALNRYLAVARPLVDAGLVTLPTADGILALRGVVEMGEPADEADARQSLERALAADIAGVLDDLALARAEEGRALQAVIAGLIDQIILLVQAARSVAATQPALIRDRFARRLEELAGDAATQDRILQEAAAMAVRADVLEELDRLVAHTGAARGLLTESTGSGRRLDFLAQEFMREANTLTAKSASPDLTAIGLELKAVIDALREQVQNVE